MASQALAPKLCGIMSPPVPKPRASARATKAPPPPTHAPLDRDDAMQALVHELRVHQIELLQQNEELRRTQDDLAAARDRFIDLFDFAPVGYLTLDGAGRVVEANLTAAAQFGIDRAALIGVPFMRFIAAADGDRWQRVKALAMRRGDSRRIELVLQRPGGALFSAQLDCARVAPEGTKPQLRIALTDISERKLAENNRRIANDVRESERRHVAYELHEDLAQRLSALKITLACLDPAAGAAANKAIVGSMNAAIDQALAMVVRLSAELHPLMLHNLGLNAALEALAGNASARLGVTVTLQLDDNEPPLVESTAVAVYRLTELLLAPLARHARRGVGIELLRRPHDVVLQMQADAGRPSEVSPSNDDADALQAVKDQVHLLGGRLELSDPQDAVRRITICLPLLLS
jgi:PAS domain S-box-containing protein